MTYDPYRNATTPRDPYDYNRDLPGSSGLGMLFGALMLLAIGGFIYFAGSGSDNTVATNDMRPPITQPSTTGSGSNTPDPARPPQ